MTDNKGWTTTNDRRPIVAPPPLRPSTIPQRLAAAAAIEAERRDEELSAMLAEKLGPFWRAWYAKAGVVEIGTGGPGNHLVLGSGRTKEEAMQMAGLL